MGPPLSGLGPDAPFRGMEPEHFSIALRSASGPLAAPIPPQQHLISPTAFDILLGWVGNEAVGSQVGSSRGGRGRGDGGRGTTPKETDGALISIIITMTTTTIISISPQAWL